MNFLESKVIDESGNLLVVYHGTDKIFKEFKLMGKDLGLHFGTLEHARYRIQKINNPKDGRIISAILNITNPLEIDDIFGSPYYLFRKLSPNEGFDGYGILTDDEEEYIWEKYGKDFEELDCYYTYNDDLFYEDIINILQKKGYDGIKYLNEVEKSSDSKYEYSWIVFNPKQIIILDEEKGT